MKVIFACLVSTLLVTSAFAEELGKKAVSLYDYIASENRAADKAGKKDADFTFKGAYVKMHLLKVEKSNSEIYVYKSELAGKSGAIPVIVLANSAFNMEYEKVAIKEKNFIKQARQLAAFTEQKMHSLDGAQVRAEMFVIAKPMGWKSYVHPVDGSTDKTIAFEVIEVCKGDSYSTCRPVGK